MLYLIQKLPSCKNPKNAVVKKRCEIQSGDQEMHGCDGRLKAKFLIMTIRVNLCYLLHVSLNLALNSPELSLINFLHLAYLHSHAFHNSILGATPFFTAGLFLDYILLLLAIAYYKVGRLHACFYLSYSL